MEFEKLLQEKVAAHRLPIPDRWLTPLLEIATAFKKVSGITLHWRYWKRVYSQDEDYADGCWLTISCQGRELSHWDVEFYDDASAIAITRVCSGEPWKFIEDRATLGQWFLSAVESDLPEVVFASKIESAG